MANADSTSSTTSDSHGCMEETTDPGFMGAARACALFGEFQRINRAQINEQIELYEPYADCLSKTLKECPPEQWRAMMLAMGEMFSLVFGGCCPGDDDWFPFGYVVPKELAALKELFAIGGRAS